MSDHDDDIYCIYGEKIFQISRTVFGLDFTILQTPTVLLLYLINFFLKEKKSIKWNNKRQAFLLWA